MAPDEKRSSFFHSPDSQNADTLEPQSSNPDLSTASITTPLPSLFPSPPRGAHASTASSPTLVSSASASGHSTPTSMCFSSGETPSHSINSTSNPKLPSMHTPAPLIPHATNVWRTDPKYADWSDDEADFALPSSPTTTASPFSSSSSLPPWARMLRSRIPRRVQRHLWLYATLLVVLWAAWRWWLRPRWEEERLLERMFEVQERMGFVPGRNVRPVFGGMVQVGRLDEGFLPGGEEGGAERRLVFVGDVHGCKDELVALLDKLAFRPSTDHLILTGDLVAKGPDSPGVVDLARSLAASCVRGNHDDRMLLAWQNMRAHHQLPSPDSPAPSSSSSSSSSSHGDARHRALARQFNKDQIAWLQQCPVILSVGHVPGLGDTVVVHAGLVPGVPLEAQDPFQAMNMRSVDVYTRVPTEDRSGVPWERVWDRWQERVRRRGEGEGVTVVYGHDSKRGVVKRRWSRGLDSGCVGGGRLTALVVGGRGEQAYFSVKCTGKKRE